jgi:hypothetical protein
LAWAKALPLPTLSRTIPINNRYAILFIAFLFS